MKLGLLVIALAACGGMKRSQTVYRADTQQLLASRTSQLESCYAKTLAANGQASGLVTVSFTVEKKTGKLKEAKADQAHTTAPEPVVLCVLESLAGLTLQPPDGNDGKATFAYDLHPAS
jgi:hypothetical protein